VSLLHRRQSGKPLKVVKVVSKWSLNKLVQFAGFEYGVEGWPCLRNQRAGGSEGQSDSHQEVAQKHL